MQRHIASLGAVLRFFPIWFGLPYAQARPDETAALGLAVSIRSGDLNPHFFHWPSFALYVFAGVHAALSWTRRVMGVSQELTFIELAVSARAVVAWAGTMTLVARYVPPTPGVQSPFLWGTDAHVRELFPGATKVEHTTRMSACRYRSPEHWVEVFRNFYGPTHTAFLALDADGQAAPEDDLVTLLRSQDLGGGNGLVVPGEYLETVGKPGSRPPDGFGRRQAPSRRATGRQTGGRPR